MNLPTRISLPRRTALLSVWTGNDRDLLVKMHAVYCPDAREIVDVCCGRRRFWEDSPLKPVCIDVDPEKQPDIVGDWNNLPFLADGTVDLVVWDPPHWPTGSSSHVKFNDRYGLRDRGGSRAIIEMFPGFFREAYRYLGTRGVVFAKICDLVNGRKSRWQHVEMIQAGEAQGFTACDLIVKARARAMVSGAWDKQHHARKVHSYWLVFRKGKSCEP